MSTSGWTAPPPSATGGSQDQDVEHLRLLALFHFVAAALVALVACIPLVHLIAGVAMLASTAATPSDAAPLLFVGGFFVAFAGLWIVLATALAVCLFLAGRFLLQRSHYTFCLVTAGLACTFMPVGTVLGVFTLIVLLRPSVKALFEGPGAAAVSPPPPGTPA